MSYICHQETQVPARGERGIVSHQIETARVLFHSFHRFPPDLVTARPCDRNLPEVLVRLGRLKALIYSSDRGRPGRPRSFIHFMRTPPLLASDPQGRRLFIIGGNYRVTPFGIEG